MEEMDPMFPTPSDSDNGLLAWVWVLHWGLLVLAYFCQCGGSMLISMQKSSFPFLTAYFCTHDPLFMNLSTAPFFVSCFNDLTIPYLLHVRSYVLWGSTYRPEDLRGFLSLSLPLFLTLSRFAFASVLWCIAKSLYSYEHPIANSLLGLAVMPCIESRIEIVLYKSWIELNHESLRFGHDLKCDGSRKSLIIILIFFCKRRQSMRLCFVFPAKTNFMSMV